MICRSVQGLLEAIMAGQRQVGDALKLERRVSIDQMPVFERDVVMATEEYRIATEVRCSLPWQPIRMVAMETF